MKKLLLLLLLLAVPSDSAPHTAAQSRQTTTDSERYRAPAPSPEAKAEMEAKLDEARARYEQNPKEADALIWLGRRTAYLGRFDEAIAIYTEGIRRYPRDARMYRHRGHRYITTRRFELAIKDLEKSAKLIAKRPDEVEPDGQPNARGIPTSTLNSNVWYHLGLAYYLKGDFNKALGAYRECLKFSRNPDMLAATAHWLYMTLRRLNHEDEARQVLAGVRDDADIIENHDYQRLVMMYKGKLKPAALYLEALKRPDSVGFASTAYGIGNWYLYNGDRANAAWVFLKITDGPQRTSFGYIAAEAEMKRAGLLDLQRLPVRVIRE